MLYISTSKIRESTVGASFTVTFSVAPEEVGYLTALHEKYAEMNMCGFTIKPSDSEKPNNCETCNHYKLTCDLFSEICKYEPKTEPQTDCNRYVIVNGEGERVYDCIGCMTDCAWKKGEE